MQRGTFGAGPLTKAGQLAALLQNKKIFYVNIEEPVYSAEAVGRGSPPDKKGSTTETVIEDTDGIACTAEKDTITFRGNGKTASFVILENAQIITSKTAEAEVVTTFAENGGLQIKGNNSHDLIIP